MKRYFAFLFFCAAFSLRAQVLNPSMIDSSSSLFITKGFLLNVLNGAIPDSLLFTHPLVLRSATNSLSLWYNQTSNTIFNTNISGYLTVSPSGGRVGIGMTPTQKLEVLGGNGSYIQSTSTQSGAANYAGFRIKSWTGAAAEEWRMIGGAPTGGNSDFIIANLSNAGMLWLSGNTGNFGIGSFAVAPVVKLQIISTTEQIRGSYDLTHFLSQFTDAAGKTTFTPNGADSTVAIAGNLAGCTLVRDTSAFVTTGTRIAIYIRGATSTDNYTITPRFLAETLPAAGDILAYNAKIDSLIVTRLSGALGTNGLKISWQRIK